MFCLVCDRVRMIRESTNPYFIYELETGYVVLGDHQHFYGYTLFLLKDHIAELHQIPKETRLKHLEELSLVYEAVFNAFKPEKMNCELLGNGAAHVHWHLFPRRPGDTPEKGPVWWLPKEEMYGDEKKPSAAELEQMKEILKREIERLIIKGEASI